ncbi:nuclear transport factor 2 family protein [Cysteiniphilum sp. JM-1]|uniref:nuclear transport factor 2 family protein n=1 Tax=Cysteiniphilum sp. JM-1 TaxID=2610891 RepID=UPI001247B79A|nr:nuclear transport factor 2 family protein [Cysteiniphilum sp. JM-1]
MNQHNLTIVRNFLAHQKNAQADQALALIAEDALWHSDSIGAPWSGDFHGKAEIIRHFANIRQSVTSFSKTPMDIVASDNTSFVYEYGYLECTFKHNNEFFATYIISIYEIKDNQIISYRVLEDSNTLYHTYHKTSDTKETL